MRLAPLTLALLATAAAYAAPGGTVVSQHAASVSVTIYRDDLALITETRSVNLPAEPVTLEFADVGETLMPETAIVSGMDRALIESNFDADQLSPDSLIAKSIGKAVTVTRTDHHSGRVTQVQATIVAANDGVILQMANGIEALHCSGVAERLEFTSTEGLVSRPKLSVRLAAGKPGLKQIKLSYLATGFSWSADYLAHLNRRRNRMDLAGWMTLVNQTDSSFPGAQVQVVAGTLNRAQSEEDGYNDEVAEDRTSDQASLFGHCYTLTPIRKRSRGVRGVPAEEGLDEVIVTAARQAKRETLGDYQLYRIPWRTDLHAHQTKQVAFLGKSSVRVEWFYGVRLPGFDTKNENDLVPANLFLGWKNTIAAGLGEPLPGGTVRVFESGNTGDLFSGDAQINDTPVGVPVEIRFGEAMNVVVVVARTYEEDPRARWVKTHAGIRIHNELSVPALVEVRQESQSPNGYQLRATSASRPTQHKSGDLMWRTTVRPGKDEILQYNLIVNIASPQR